MIPKIIIIKDDDKILSIKTNITDKFEVIVVDNFHNSAMEKLDNECEINDKYYIDVDVTEKYHIAEWVIAIEEHFY